MIPSTVLRVVLSLCFLCCTSGGSSAEKQEPRKLTDPEKRLVQSCNDFAFRLLVKVNQTETGKNVFVSPFSVSMALDMALSGADGLTETAMMATLGYAGTTRQEINETSNELMKLLRNLDPRVQMLLANSIWYRRGLTIEPEFIETNQRYYNRVCETWPSDRLKRRKSSTRGSTRARRGKFAGLFRIKSRQTW